MAAGFNFIQQIVQQVSPGTPPKSVSGSAGTKPPAGIASHPEASEGDVDFSRTLQNVSENQTSAGAPSEADDQHPALDENSLQTDGLGDGTADSAVNAANLIGGQRHHPAAGHTPVVLQNAASVKIELLALLKTLGFENVPLADNGGLLRATAEEAPVRPVHSGGKDAEPNSAGRQIILQKLETLLKPLQISATSKVTPDMQRLVDEIRAMGNAKGAAESKTAEIAKLVQQLIAKSDNGWAEGNIQHSGIRSHAAAMSDTDKAFMAKVAKMPIPEDSAQRVQVDTMRWDAGKINWAAENSAGEKAHEARISPADILKSAGQGDISSHPTQSNDEHPGSRAKTLNDIVKEALIGQGNARNTPPKSSGDSGVKHADSNLFSNPSMPKSENGSPNINIAGLRPEAAPAPETGARILNPDAAKEEALSFSQHQSELKALEGQLSVKAAESIPKDIRSQTLDHIVQKAVMQFKNGQNEVQLNLKPDFLGQIRLQIITESQQVTVRILAEYPLIKELIENNVQQLKSGLQQYGLEIDELEVSVAHDSEQHVADRRKAAGSRLQKPSEDGDPKAETISENAVSPASQTSADAENTRIDFFA